MLHRRPTAIAALLVVLAGPLSACGFDYPTDRVNTIAAGVTDRSADIDALGIQILSTEAGSGRVIGALANNTTEDASLDSVTGEGVVTEAFEPIEVAAGGGTNLAAEDTTPIPVTGDFVAGEFVEIELGFSTGETLQLNVPVVKICHYYSDVPTPASETESTEATEEPGEGETLGEAVEEAEDAVEATDEAHGDEHAEGESQAYLCEHELTVEGH